MLTKVDFGTLFETLLYNNYNYTSWQYYQIQSEWKELEKK